MPLNRKNLLSQLMKKVLRLARGPINRITKPRRYYALEHKRSWICKSMGPFSFLWLTFLIPLWGRLWHLLKPFQSQQIITHCYRQVKGIFRLDFLTFVICQSTSLFSAMAFKFTSLCQDIWSYYYYYFGEGRSSHFWFHVKKAFDSRVRIKRCSRLVWQRNN